jgi:hypothetical protein
MFGIFKRDNNVAERSGQLDLNPKDIGLWSNMGRWEETAEIYMRRVLYLVF